MGSHVASAVIEQRQSRPHHESATEFLRDFPALLALSRLAVPILAVDDSGVIEFANESFATMVGFSRDALLTMTAQDLAPCIPDCSTSVVAVLRGYAHQVIRLRHADGWTMPALISDSVLLREAEKLAVVAFTDLTEINWASCPDEDLLPG